MPVPTIYPANRGDAPSSDSKGGNDELLREIRENFQLCVEAEEDIRKEGRLDMRALSMDGPWEPTERASRKELNRPCLHIDQLTQYRNQLVNEVRSNKRAVKVTPVGDGANDKKAELRAARVRQIEYESNAQYAYITAFENACDRSYGAFRINKKYLANDTDEQTLCVVRIPNPDCVYMDPYCKEADYSDANFAFVIDSFTKSEFKRRYGKKASQISFSAEAAGLAPMWFRDDRIQVAEYWKVNLKSRRLVVMDVEKFTEEQRQLLQLWLGSDKTRFFEDDAEAKGAEVTAMYLDIQGSRLPIKRFRDVEERQVCQYTTNGVEILGEKVEWEGQWIPIVKMVGIQKFINDGSRTREVLLSLIRMARDAQLLYDHAVSGKQKVLAMTPKTPWIMYENQEDTSTDWQSIHKIPTGYATVKAKTDQSGEQILPHPQRIAFEPPIQAYELAKESFARAIQNALGSTSLERKDRVAKSGKALESLAREQSLGTFHFIDNYDRSVAFGGRIIDDMLEKIEDTDREVGLRMEDESYDVVRINAPDQNGEVKSYGPGRYDVTISTGPSYQSQREEVSDFLETLATMPDLFARVAHLAVKLKNLGPLGDQISKLLEPPGTSGPNGEELPPEAQQIIQKQQQDLQAINAAFDAVEAELKKLQAEKQAKVVENESRERIADKNNVNDIIIQRMQNEIKRIELMVEKAIADAKLRADVTLKAEQMDSQEQMHERQIESGETIAAESNQVTRETAAQKSKEKSGD